MDPDHFLYDILSRSSDTRQVRIRSRHPFVPATRNLSDKLTGLFIGASEWKNYR